MPTFSVRLTIDELDDAKRAASSRGFATTNAFIRNAIAREIRDHSGSQTAPEEAKRVDDSLQAILTWLDCLTKAIFLRVANPTHEQLAINRQDARRDHMALRRRVAQQLEALNAADASFWKPDDSSRRASISDHAAETDGSKRPVYPLENPDDEAPEERYDDGPF